MHCLAVGFCVAALSLLTASASFAADISRVLPPGEKPDDVRLKPLRTLNDKYHPWSPPESKEAWEKEAERIRRQILVSNGLWPLPEKTPLDAVIHGPVDRGDYTVEKVVFRSRPGVYVTGSLYRPKKTSTEKRPAVLCPHGHWLNGRFYDSPPKEAADLLKSGAESYLSGARCPLQAIEVQLARMGCVAFVFDTVGTADNLALPHREGFNDVQAELWLQNKMGLQTWNSIRALDFVESLPDVDPKRIGVTGASGGGTQTFILCAIDPRAAVAFPAVMVGTAMQGGCQCENASYMRQGINNVAIAALIAPRPLGMTGANDWTIDIETKGLPELKKIYALYGQEENVAAKCFPQFPHNYNEVSREVMFAWMAKHFGLGHVEVDQTDFWPLTREEMTVFDQTHPAPADWLDAERLRAEMAKESRELMASLEPKKEADVQRFLDVVGTAVDVMVGPRTEPAAIKVKAIGDTERGVQKLLISAGGRSVPAVVLEPTGTPKNETVLWIDGRGKSRLFDAGGKPISAVAKLLAGGYRVALVDVFLTGEFLAEGETAKYAVNANFPGYTYCYNAPLISQRARDIVLAHDALERFGTVGPVHLVGVEGAGPWTLLAQAQMRSPTSKTIVDLNRFRFQNITSADDPNVLPGALRYGDIQGLAALAAIGGKLTISGEGGGDWSVLLSASNSSKGSFELSNDVLRDETLLKALGIQ
ncbi:hypothetical protein Pan44_46900 [Caulifigura coniformis]|uniref:Uncharacterized protein n=1 Tax=Caulifigura coniformis TaxID=2527983 RepID=A0A517SKI5_9PLAN|nr:acetylxylan esterase [Caulifigura coniformis]QDT56633.1 hypothetical protein Pan44_46900 [Caulifigura coniformis]